MSPTPEKPYPYDLAVCYRIYPRISGKPLFNFRDKLELVRLNLSTFAAAVGGLKVKVWVLLDKCPPEYPAMVREILPWPGLEIVPLSGEGNEATFSRQIEVLTTQNEADLVYFAEDDYVYLPRALELTVKFMKDHPEADFATVYDHADYHSMYIHRNRSPQYAESGEVWRQVTSTCLTFMARRQALVDTADVFRTYSRRNSDLGVWMALTKTHVTNPWSFIRAIGDGLFVAASHFLAWRHAPAYILRGRRRTLWAPCPALATHMESKGVAPGVDWAAVRSELKQN